MGVCFSLILASYLGSTLKVVQTIMSLLGLGLNFVSSIDLT